MMASTTCATAATTTTTTHATTTTTTTQRRVWHCVWHYVMGAAGVFVFFWLCVYRRLHYLAVIQRLRDEHQCDAVVLGCTELPLILNNEVSPLPTLDSTRLLARAAITRAVNP